eukprot:1215281-Rhodomonas_salina.1
MVVEGQRRLDETESASGLRACACGRAGRGGANVLRAWQPRCHLQRGRGHARGVSGRGIARGGGDGEQVSVCGRVVLQGAREGRAECKVLKQVKVCIHRVTVCRRCAAGGEQQVCVRPVCEIGGVHTECAAVGVQQVCAAGGVHAVWASGVCIRWCAAGVQQVCAAGVQQVRIRRRLAHAATAPEWLPGSCTLCGTDRGDGGAACNFEQMLSTSTQLETTLAATLLRNRGSGQLMQHD